MEAYVKGNTYNRTASIKDGVVTIKHVSKLKDGPHYMTTRLNMANMEGDEVMVHAAYNVLIQIIRPRALKIYNADQIDEERVHDPVDYPARRGGGIDKREAAIRVVESLGISRADAEKVIDNPTDAKAILAKIINK